MKRIPEFCLIDSFTLENYIFVVIAVAFGLRFDNFPPSIIVVARIDRVSLSIDFKNFVSSLDFLKFFFTILKSSGIKIKEIP